MKKIAKRPKYYEEKDMDLVREIKMGKGEERLRILVFFPLLEKSLRPLYGGGGERVGLWVNGE